MTECDLFSSFDDEFGSFTAEETAILSEEADAPDSSGEEAEEADVPPSSSDEEAGAQQQQQQREEGELRQFEARYFVLCCETAETIGISVEKGVWGTLPRNEAKLEASFETTDMARCIVCVRDPSSAVGGNSAHSSLSRSQVTLIFRQNGTGAIAGYGTMATGIHGTESYWAGKRLGGTFGVQWERLCDVPLRSLSAIQNPWNEKGLTSLTRTRDGQELEPSVGRRVVEAIEARATHLGLAPMARRPAGPPPALERPLPPPPPMRDTSRDITAEDIAEVEALIAGGKKNKKRKGRSADTPGDVYAAQHWQQQQQFGMQQQLAYEMWQYQRISHAYGWGAGWQW